MRDQRDQSDQSDRSGRSGQNGRPGQRTPSAPADHRDPVVRGANSIDRYSLALQLIQVFPIILTGVAVVFPYEWLRIVIAVLGLTVWTGWAILRERHAESDDGHTAGDEALLLQTAIPLQTAMEMALTPTTATATTAESVRGIRVDIFLHPGHPGTGPVARGPAGRRHRQSPPPRAHRSLPPKPQPHQHSHTDEPEPEDRPGNPSRLSLAPGRGAEAFSVLRRKENPWATKPSSIW